MSGKLIIFSAPSGAGKTTLVKKLLNSDLKLEFSISACSRPKRSNEIDGKDYYFLDVEDFKRKIENKEFLEWEEVYKDQFYGSLRTELDRIWAKGNHAIFDVDVVGGLNIKKEFADRALAVFVMPPSMKVLEERLIGRSTESEESLKKRLDKAENELAFANQFDVQIINHDKDAASVEARIIILEFLNKD